VPSKPYLLRSQFPLKKTILAFPSTPDKETSGNPQEILKGKPRPQEGLGERIKGAGQASLPPTIICYQFDYFGYDVQYAMLSIFSQGLTGKTKDSLNKNRKRVRIWSINWTKCFT